MLGDNIKVNNAYLVKKYLSIEKNFETKTRLVFLNTFAYSRLSLEESCLANGIGISTGYGLVQRWNNYGYEGIVSKPRKGGPKPRLSEQDKKRLKEILIQEGPCDIKTVQKIVKKYFKVHYSQSHLARILKELGMNFSKPYPEDYRKPLNYKAILGKRLHKEFREIIESEGNTDGVVLGFVDEFSPQNSANTARLWGFGKIIAMKNTSKSGINSVGFYSLNGNSVIDFPKRFRAENFVEFVKEIVAKNSGATRIVIVLDNASAHKAKLSKKACKKLGVSLVFLPPYSPDINPIEFIWKSIKRELSKTLLPTRAEMIEIIKNTWKHCSSKLSYAKRWIKSFLEGKEFSLVLC